MSEVSCSNGQSMDQKLISSKSNNHSDTYNWCSLLFAEVKVKLKNVFFLYRWRKLYMACWSWDKMAPKKWFEMTGIIHNRKQQMPIIRTKYHYMVLWLLNEREAWSCQHRQVPKAWIKENLFPALLHCDKITAKWHQPHLVHSMTTAM